MQNILKIGFLSNQYIENDPYSTKKAQQAYTWIDANTFQKIQEEKDFFNVTAQNQSEWIQCSNTLAWNQFIADLVEFRKKIQTMKLAFKKVKSSWVN